LFTYVPFHKEARMKRIFLLCVLLLAFCLTAYTQESEVGEAKVYDMPNGMKVILIEKHANPVIASMIYVRAGSKYETEFNNGITHFLEHLLFDGTKTKSRTDITEGIKSKGGYINAFTQKDLTAYMVVMPKEFIEQGIRTQADMLFNSIFPEEESAKERKIVIEEIKKDKDNIQEQVSDFFDSQVFANTPYARPVLGYENIISNLGKDEIADYYHTYYEPNNMIALLIGDFQENEIKELIERHFGNIPAQILPVKAKASYSAPKEIVVKRKELPTQNSYVNICFDGPLYSNSDFYTFDILSKLLSSEESSPLSQALLGGERPLANQISVDLNMQEEFTKLNIQVITDSASLKMQNSHKVEAILNKTVEVLNKLSESPPSKATLERILVSTKTEDYLLEERLHFYGMLEAGTIVNAGYEFLENYIPNLEKVQPKEIQRVAKKYLYKAPYFATVNTPLSNKEKAEETKSTSSYRKEVLPNGLTVIVKTNSDSKVLAINILGKNRSIMEPEGKEGIADFTNRMLLKGTKNRTAEQLSNDLALVGAQITNVDNPYIPYDDRYTTKSFTFFRFETIDEYADKGIEILADIIKNSNFPQDQIEKVKAEMMGLLGMEGSSTYQTARDLFYAELFKGHPFSKTINGNRRSIGGITQEDLTRFHKTFYSPNNIIITVATNVSVDEMMNKIKLYFGDMPKVDFAFTNIPVPTKPTSPSKVEKKMEKEQIYVYLGSLLPGIESQDMPAIEVMNEVLSSRLAQELREKQGLAYSVGSSSNFEKGFGWFVASIGTQPQNREIALNGILEEMKKMKRELPSSEELEKAKNSIWGNLLMGRLSRINQAHYMGVYEFEGLGYDYDEKYIKQIRGVTAEEVKQAAVKYLDTENYVLAVVGKI
jgi:zinc protease